jgi:NAD(P)-dependent dehydrogenase (short-subunit alcohol dehydrogenase family)
LKLNGKIAIVTGGGSGIGRSTAIRFAKEGAKVAVADLDSQSGEETVSLIQESGGEAIFIKTDVKDSNQVKELINTSTNTFGGLHILVNNAGIGHSEVRSVDLSEEEWDHVIDINLKGVFLGIKYAIPEMKKSGGGAIINTSSLLGLKGKKYQAAYNASRQV